AVNSCASAHWANSSAISGFNVYDFDTRDCTECASSLYGIMDQSFYAVFSTIVIITVNTTITIIKTVTFLNAFKTALLGSNTNPCLAFNHLISHALLA